MLFLFHDQGLISGEEFCSCMVRTSVKTWICRTTCTQHLTSVEDTKF